LCGGLNVNEFRLLIREIQAWNAKGVEVDLALLGSKAVQFFRNLKVNVVAQHSNIGEDPRVADLMLAIKIMLDAYEKGGEAGGIDRLFLMHNVFESMMSQKPVVKTLIPVEAPDADELPQHWDYIYEPEAVELLTTVLQRYIESQVYRGAVENVACEMAAKKLAMKSATDNAGQLIDNLKLDYNKARQAAITQEISEIVGGAAAVSE
jgi:F-type H+-transporting ATPase subunit gamma